MKVYQQIASTIDAYKRCAASDDMTEWESRHFARLERIARECLPSGSGFDSGTGIDIDRSSGDKLVLNTAFHHMNEHGYYDGWTYHTIIVRPSLIHRFTFSSISGRDRNDIKEYIAQAFEQALSEDMPERVLAD